MQSPKVAIRETLPGDEGAIIDLLRERDERAHEPEDVRRALFRMDPALFRAWMAFDGGRPVGITALYVRDVQWQGERRRAGYWSHLYVNPDYRRIMLYPNLVMSMMRGSKSRGPGGGAAMDFLYTGTRRKEVAEAHVRIGFGLCGYLMVRVKPIRPGRLIARHKGLPAAVGALARAPDAAYAAILALRRPRAPKGMQIEEFALEDPTAGAAFAGMLNSAAGGRFAQIWTAEQIGRRFSGAIDGHGYTALAARRGDQVLAAIIVRMAERGAGVGVGVVMNFVDLSTDRSLARLLLGEAERQCAARGADVMILLDGAGPHESQAARRMGYRESSETYQMTAWPKHVCLPGSWGADLANWRFAFADHDAF